jgi:hypothetical protein
MVSVLGQGSLVPWLARRLGVGMRETELRAPYPQHG